MIRTQTASVRVAAIDARNRAPMDANRIIGISGTIALNVLLLMLLLAPLRQPVDIRMPEIVPVLDWIEAKPVKPDPPTPIPVEVLPPQTRAQPEVRAEVTHPVDEPVIADQGTLPAQASAPTPSVEISLPSIEPARPAAGARLEYLEAPAPRYPRDLLLAGIEGTVLLQVLVGIDGRPIEVSVKQGSGHREFDQAASRQVVRSWRFRPAMQDGRAVQAMGIVPIEFTLDR